MSEQKKVDKISDEDRLAIVKGRQEALNKAMVAERAVSEARIAELENRIKVRDTYLKYGLETTCKIDENTGSVSWPVETKVVQNQCELGEKE